MNRLHISRLARLAGLLGFLVPASLLGLQLTLPATARAGPNDGGMLVLHYEPNVAFTLDGDWCGWSSVPNRNCENIITQVAQADGQGVIFYVMAAFPDFAMPRLKGVSFGIDFDNPLIEPAAWGACGGYDSMTVPTSNWPASGSGILIVFDSPASRRLNEVCWFAGYAYPGEIRVTEHPDPNYGGHMGDDSVPAVLDEIAAYGVLGFGHPGVNPCASGEATGACCTPDGQCFIQTSASCTWNNYAYYGDGSTCDPSPCKPGAGACCLRTSCEMLSFDECMEAGGTYMGLGTSCDPTPCDFRSIEQSFGQIKNRYRYGP